MQINSIETTKTTRTETIDVDTNNTSIETIDLESRSNGKNNVINITNIKGKLRYAMIIRIEINVQVKNILCIFNHTKSSSK